MMDMRTFRRIVNGSKRYEFDSGMILTVTDYMTGDSVKLDLSCLTEEMLEELIVEDDEDEEEEW